MKNQIKKWEEWFAGFIDGDGSILVYKDHVSIEATTSIEDEGILTEIKKKFGGSIKPRSNARALRWRSRKKDVVIKVIKTLNGNIYNKIRIEQLKKACIFYEIEYIEPKPTNFAQSSYLAGLFDADGSISIVSKNNDKKKEKEEEKKKEEENKDYRKKINRGKGNKEERKLTNIPGVYGKVERLINSKGANQCIIKCTNKNKENIEMFKDLKIGEFYYEKNKEKQTKWHWIIKKSEIYKFLNYLNENPIKGKKKKQRFHLLQEYIRLKEIEAHIAKKESILFKEWTKFCKKWYNIQEE